jgi:hypothetical protein
MEDQLLLVLSCDASGFPLRTLLGALRSAGHPATLSAGIAGEASEAELDSEEWEAVFVRWTEPELHDVALIEKDIVAESDTARQLIASSRRRIANNTDPGGEILVADHLRRTEAVYAVQVLPALVEAEDHAAWGALDVVLRCIAAETSGLIVVPGEGYCDADGELILAEIDLETDEVE